MWSVANKTPLVSEPHNITPPKGDNCSHPRKEEPGSADYGISLQNAALNSPTLVTYGARRVMAMTRAENAPERPKLGLDLKLDLKQYGFNAH